MTDILSPGACFALLDDTDDAHVAPLKRSRLYTGLVARIDCDHASHIDIFFSELQERLSGGQSVVGLFSYELGAAMHQIRPRPDASPVLASALVFSRCDSLSRAEADDWLAATLIAGSDPDFSVREIRPSLSSSAFQSAVDTIHQYIDAGDTYQVNLTFPITLTVHGNPMALYAALRRRQPAPYGAFIRLPDGQSVLSFSPELFVSHQQGRLQAKPMKGTLEAGDEVVDAELSATLAGSAKNRAENLMIVDLLRNDLGQIAQTGSVKVPALFEVQRFGQVLQMTSTVEAQRREEIGLSEIFRAIYPCGSITGAPKRRTLQILRALEDRPRGWYTGAIGWFDPPEKDSSLGDFTLSVPIRTLVLDAPAGNDRRSGVIHVGAGIVHDSDARSEYAECLLKARFLTGLPSQFSLIETLQASRRGARYLDRHLQRLQSSAAHFGFACDVHQIKKDIDRACAGLAPETSYRLRLCVQSEGDAEMLIAPIHADLRLPVRLLLAAQPMQSDDIFLRHKTTLRRRYDIGWQTAEKNGAFDTLFLNEKAHLTEGGRSNLFIRRHGQWLTPPLSDGVLPGVMRARLLEDPQWHAKEAVLTLDDLRDAEAIVVCNALRGVLSAVVDWEAALVEVD